MFRYKARALLRPPAHRYSMSTRVPSFEEWRYGPQPVAPANSPLRAHEQDLPSLPVPDLKKTIAKALRSCEAIAQSDKELQAVKTKANDFLNKDGPRLQEKLLAKAANSRNWLAKVSLCHN